MKINIISHTPNPEELIATAGKLCYSNVGIEDIGSELTVEEIDRFVKHLANIGHESPLEHISFTFAVEGISRALSLQLVRHRVGVSYSQQSQRYVEMDNPTFITPNTILKYSDACEEFDKITNEITKSYSKLIDLGIPKEDARSILPNAIETKMVFTMNARALLNFFKLRCCRRAQEEIREMADEMLRQVKTIAPSVFSRAGASCMYDRCTEGDMTCGKPRKEDEYL